MPTLIHRLKRRLARIFARAVKAQLGMAAAAVAFYGFLVATLAYQFAPGDRHADVLPLAIGIGLVTLLAATFVLRHLFSAAGLVTVIIEFVGGTLFLIVLLRKGLR